MGHSIEGRLPMLDAELVEFVKRLPVHSKFLGTTEKHVLREAARPYVPAESPNGENTHSARPLGFLVARAM